MSLQTSAAVRIDFKGVLSQVLNEPNLADLNVTGDVYDEGPKVFGEGGYSEVFTAKYRRNYEQDASQAVSVTHFRAFIFSKNRNIEAMFREFSVWSKLQHPNVLPFLGYVMGNDRLGMVSPWMDKGSVRSVMNANPDKSMSHLAKGIASGLLYLHDQGIVHSEMNCENILLSESGEPVLANFGISQFITSVWTHNTSTSLKGSARWMAREFFTFALDESDIVIEHSTRTDVWAFGMVLYELLSNLVPFFELKSDVQVSLALVKGEIPPRPKSICSQEDQDLLWPICETCWQEIPSDRPDMRSIYDDLRGSEQVEND